MDSDTAIHQLLETHWGYARFKGKQLSIIKAFLSGNDVVVLLPTGAGKSICYQVPALLKTGTILVVSPLIALMEDQVMNLKSRGIKAACLHSGKSSSENAEAIEMAVNNDLNLLYVSPERILSRKFQEKLSHISISGIAVDEAHCISQWGHDFRPSYRQLSLLRELCPEANIMALSASASKQVKQEIQDQLKMRQAKTFTEQLRRKNLEIEVLDCASTQRILMQIMHHIPHVHSGIIYLRNRLLTENLAQSLSVHYSCDFYHAGLSYVQKDGKTAAMARG